LRSEKAKVSEEIMALISEVRKIIIDKINENEVDEEEVNSYLLNLLFEPIIHKLKELNFDSVKFDYKVEGKLKFVSKKF